MTARWLRDCEAHVVRSLAVADGVFCFLDYDGTLAPLAPTPHNAVPLPGASSLLRQLVAAPGVQVAIVTGRTIADVRRFLDVAGAHYVGVHGAEVCWPNGKVQVVESVGTVRAVVLEIKRRLQEAVAARPGILLEDKGVAVACHYRLAAPADAVTARETMAALAHEYRASALILVDGHEVAEIRPAHSDKGTAVHRLLAAYRAQLVPVYVGDDHTDEDAFKVLPAGSVTIRVAPADGPTLAHYRVAGPHEVLRFLRTVLQARVHASGHGRADRSPREPEHGKSTR